MIPWYVYVLISIIFGTIFTLVRKKALLKVHAMNFESARSLSIVVLSLFLIPFLNLNINTNILIIIYVVSLLATIGILLAAKSLRHKDISLIIPLANFKPAFVAVIAFFFLSEAITQKQIVGISILLIGAYLLESNHHFSNLLEPIRYLFKTKYSLYFISAIFLFSITAVFDRFIIANYTDIFTYFFLVWIFVAINFNLIHILLYGYKDIIKCFRKVTYLPILVGASSMLKNLLVYKALSLAFVSLVTPLLMLETLVVVFLGGKFFHEKYLLFRLTISAFMLVGTYLIIF